MGDISIEEVNARISTHEQVCAERYGALIERTKRIEQIMWGVAGTLSLAFLGLVMSKL
jgi:hypothetical protein